MQNPMSPMLALYTWPIISLILIRRYQLTLAILLALILGYMFLPSHIVCGLALVAIGQLMGGPYMAASMLVWGLFIRLLIVMHATWLVNSWAHMWGYRTYDTTDDSRNNWLVAVLTFGEGWHNNHHAYPRMASQGHKWWEFDATYQLIRLMKWTGLVWDVVDYKRAADRRS